MSRLLLRASACAAALAAGAVTLAADELLERLQAIPGLTVVQEKPTTTGARFFLLTYEQPVNHLKPWKGTFRQRVSLYHQGFELPTVLYSSGYNYSSNPVTTEVTRIVGGNQLGVEHRFFLPSRPDPPDWRDLTIFQQASDDHRLATAFRSLYPGRWLRTGGSKGGMQATYHQRFYPQDVDGLIAYVAPNDAIDAHDAYIPFLDHVGNDPECREQLKRVQREALLRRDEIVPMIVEQLGPDAFDQVLGTPEKALEILVTEMPFTFWQFGSQEQCALVPPADASTEDVFFFLDALPGFFFFTDDFIVGFEPYYFQAGTQLGYPKVADDHFADLLLYPGADVPRSFVRPEVEMFPFQWWAMLDVDLYVRFVGRRMMFLYGELDPWGAERFEPGPHSVDSYVYVVPGGNHGARVLDLPPPQSEAAIATIRRWAGLPPLDGPGLAALRTRPTTPDLDWTDRMTRRHRGGGVR
jgi:hypothetical protein